MTITNQTPSKQPLLELIKTTFIGGLLIVLPAYLAILVLNQMINGLVALTVSLLKPIAATLGLAKEDMALPFAFIVFILICFVAGLIVKTNYSKVFAKTLAPVFNKIPGYLLIRRIANRTIKVEQGEDYDTAFVALGDSTEALSPGFLIEKHENETSTVFVPAVPTPTVGSLYIVPNHRIYPVNVSLLDMAKFISRWGEASPVLLEAIQKIEITRSNSEQSLPEDISN